MSIVWERSAAGQAAPRDIDQFAALINKYTFKFAKRAAGLGAHMDVDDIRQELSLVFVKATQSYDETKAASFMNFLITSWYYEMNRLMKKDQRNREEGITLHANSQVGEDDEVIGGSMFDRVDSGWASPEQNLEAMDALQYGLEGLSDQARVLVETLLDPPDAIAEQFSLAHAGIHQRNLADKAKRRLYHEVTLKFLFALFRVPVSAARRIEDEIKQKMGSAFLLQGNV